MTRLSEIHKQLQILNGLISKYKRQNINIKTSYKKNGFKISVPTWNEEFELLDHILYQIFKTILKIYLKNMRKRLIILQYDYM